MPGSAFTSVLHALMICSGTLGIAAGTAFNPAAASASTIKPFPAWDGSSLLQPWGVDGFFSTPIYGQTITVDDPARAYLNSFSFAINIAGPQP